MPTANAPKDGQTKKQKLNQGGTKTEFTTKQGKTKRTEMTE